MNEALQYARQFDIDSTIHTKLDVNPRLLQELPNWWLNVMRAQGKERIDLTLRSWRSFQNLMPMVFDILDRRLRSVNLLTSGSSVRLLYEIETYGEMVYYVGGNPLQMTMAPNVRAEWQFLPEHFRRFYAGLHNGWYYLASRDMGLSATEDMIILSDFEWGILEDIEDPGCNLDHLLSVYSNGMGAYVCLNTLPESRDGDVLWWKAESPWLNINAWGVIDAWTEIFLNQPD